MRFVRNEIQTPKYIIQPELRKTSAFYMLMVAIALFSIGGVAFFGFFLIRDILRSQFSIEYRSAQTYALMVGGVGILLYIIAGLVLKISLKNTSYYKLKTIINNEPYDPPRKGDFTKSIYARLAPFDDQWALFSEIKLPDIDYKIPQVIVGPGGVFSIYPSNKNASRRSYPDAGAFLKEASQQLEKKIGNPVIPIILFPTAKLASIYKDKRKQQTRVMHILEIADYLKNRRRKIKKDKRTAIENQVYALIEGTPPGV